MRSLERRKRQKFCPRKWFKHQTAETGNEIPSLVFGSILRSARFTLQAMRINPLTPNDPYRGRTATLTSKRCILYIYSTNIGTEYFKHGIYSPFFSLQNTVCFIILTYLVLVLFKHQTAETGNEIPSLVFGSILQSARFTLPAMRINLLTPNDPYRGRTAPLTSKRCILYIYSTNIGTEHFKHGIYSPFFFLFKIQFVS